MPFAHIESFTIPRIDEAIHVISKFLGDTDW